MKNKKNLKVFGWNRETLITMIHYHVTCISSLSAKLPPLSTCQSEFQSQTLFGPQNEKILGVFFWFFFFLKKCKGICWGCVCGGGGGGLF